MEAPMSRKGQGRRAFRPRVEALERRELLTAGLQVVHNSPYSAAAVVDVYVNDALAIEDFAFRKATPFLDLPSGSDLKIDIRGANSPSNSKPVFTTTVNLTDGKDYLAMAVGEPGSTFSIAVTDLGRRVAAKPANAEFLVFHEATGRPCRRLTGPWCGKAGERLVLHEVHLDYVSTPPSNYTVDITLEDGLTRVAAFQADPVFRRGRGTGGRRLRLCRAAESQRPRIPAACHLPGRKNCLTPRSSAGDRGDKRARPFHRQTQGWESGHPPGDRSAFASHAVSSRRPRQASRSEAWPVMIR